MCDNIEEGYYYLKRWEDEEDYERLVWEYGDDVMDSKEYLNLIGLDDKEQEIVLAIGLDKFIEFDKLKWKYGADCERLKEELDLFCENNNIVENSKILEDDVIFFCENDLYWGSEEELILQ